MLKQRILTALVIAPMAFALVFFASPEVFRTAMSVLWLVSAIEYARLANLGKAGTALLLIVQASIFMIFFNFWEYTTQLSFALLAGGCLIWCLMLLQLAAFKPDRPASKMYSALGFSSAIASMTFVWLALSLIRDLPNGQYWILCLLMIVWAADIGGYFSGRHFGGRKLSPSISPSKTWAGFWGGMVLALVVTAAYTKLLPFLQVNPLKISVIAAVTMLISVGGDLFISIQKRTLGLKDTGNLLPGHGGLLDRFDSLVSAAPFFAFGLLLISR
ncbi:MAG TPA: phosphatidate cytidylyltransferase [Xanthomonadales bacterium]|nr:phosphatidate cytidylyltransferase [Xanthomonadales bacterium]